VWRTYDNFNSLFGELSLTVACYKISILLLKAKEMLMRRTRRKAPYLLGDLFTPPPTRPTWNNLSETVRQKVAVLLAEMVRTQSDPQPLRADEKEADDE
jgi:hypothetical protein